MWFNNPNNSSIYNGQKQFSSTYITYTLLMQAQEALNEDALDDEQDAEVLADLNDIFWLEIEHQ